jgi:parallel beta-helix repeat protein
MSDYQVTVSLGGTPASTGQYLVTAYGADPTGVASSTTAINNAIAAAAAAGGGTVIMPPGSYRLSAVILFNAVTGVHIVGAGSGATVISPVTSGIEGVHFYRSSDCSITGVTVQNFVGTGEFAGIRISYGFRNRVQDCVISGCDDAGISAGYDIYQYFALSDADKRDPSLVYDGGSHIISGNVISGTTQGAGIEILRADDCVISDNVIYDINTHGIRILGSYGTMASGNRISNCGQSGIAIQAYGDAEPIGVTKISQRIAATGNLIDGPSGIMCVSGAKDCTIVGNDITVTDDTGGIGVYLPYSDNPTTVADYELQNILISDNSIRGGSLGVYLSAGGTSIRIAGNMISDFDWAGCWIETDTSSGLDLKWLYVRDNHFVTGDRHPSHDLKYGINMIGVHLYAVLGGNVFDMTGYDIPGPHAFTALMVDADAQATVRTDPISVADFGAVGDHVIDDSAAINYALDAIAQMGSGEIYFPAGYYLCPTVAAITTADIVATGDVPDDLVGGGPRLLRGTGSPQGVMNAPIGSIYQDVNGSIGSSTWLKGKSKTANTGWNPIGNYVLTAAANDTTPAVTAATHLLLPANSGVTAITQLDDAYYGQQVTLVQTVTTGGAVYASKIVDGGNFKLIADWTPDADDTLTLFTVDGTTWREICRAYN